MASQLFMRGLMVPIMYIGTGIGIGILYGEYKSEKDHNSQELEKFSKLKESENLNKNPSDKSNVIYVSKQ